MPAGTNHYADPDEQHGSFRVLPRTDGAWIVIDDRRDIGAKTIYAWTGKHAKEQAIAAAKTWHAQGHG